MSSFCRGRNLLHGLKNFADLNSSDRHHFRAQVLLHRRVVYVQSLASYLVGRARCFARNSSWYDGKLDKAG